MGSFMFVFMSLVLLITAVQCQLEHFVESLHFTEKQQLYFVERHNWLRSQVQPTATNMRKVRFDPKLAEIATNVSFCQR